MSNQEQRPSYKRTLYLLALLFAVSFPHLTQADGPGPAETNTEKPDTQKPDTQKVDADFAFQGEFVGTVTVEPSHFKQIALQVRAAGDGTFEAAQYMGGLPDSPNHKEPLVPLTGKLAGDFVVMSGGPWVVIGHPDYCLLVDRDGNRVGRLERVYRVSPTIGAQPPKNATVLFDGTGTDQFSNGRMTEDGLLMEGADVKPMFQDFSLHLEFMLPYMPAGRDQGRGNSGCYLQSRYEVQILDSFAMESVFNGCGSLYRFRKPDVNMCFPPLVWQTYDIIFTAPRWASDGTKVKNARITVWHNGVKTHNDLELTNKTGAGKPEGPTLLPIRFQDHGNPVRFRNLWIIDRGIAPSAGFPVRSKPEDAKPADGEKPADA
ncbi:MAG: DUF1080 domain-containing protein [Thermoguttaceae bacterium]